MAPVLIRTGTITHVAQVASYPGVIREAKGGLKVNTVSKKFHSASARLNLPRNGVRGNVKPALGAPGVMDSKRTSGQGRVSQPSSSLIVPRDSPALKSDHKLIPKVVDSNPTPATEFTDSQRLVGAT